MELLRRGEMLMISEGFVADPRFCFLEGTNTTATVGTTEKITIFAAPGQVAGGYQVRPVRRPLRPGHHQGDRRRLGDRDRTRHHRRACRDPRDRHQGQRRHVGRQERQAELQLRRRCRHRPADQAGPVVILSGGVGNDEIDSNGGGIFSHFRPTSPVRLQGDLNDDRIVVCPAPGGESRLRPGSATIGSSAPHRQLRPRRGRPRQRHRHRGSPGQAIHPSNS